MGLEITRAILTPVILTETHLFAEISQDDLDRGEGALFERDERCSPIPDALKNQDQ